MRTLILARALALGYYELQRQKKYCRTCAPSEDSDQPAHSRSQIRIFIGRILIPKDEKFLFVDKKDSDETTGHTG